MIKIYMDESGTHGGNDQYSGSRIICVAAYLAQPRAWDAFNKEWNAKKRSYGIDIYHAVDCANQRKEFAGWDKDTCNEFAREMLPIIPKHIPFGVAVGMDLHEYSRLTEPDPELRAMFETPYSACFHWVVATIMGMVEQFGDNQRLSFIHESNSYERVAEKEFLWIKGKRQKHSSIMTLAFGTKKKHTPLQAADILAYEGNKRLRGVDINAESRRAWKALSVSDGIRLRFYGKKTLPWMLKTLVEVREEIKIFGKPVTFLNREPPLTD